jgi:hypothetical protein
MNLHYVLARSVWELGEASIAEQMLDGALVRSVQLHDRRSTATPFCQSGAIKRACLETSATLHALRASREIIDDLKESRDAIPPRLEMDIAIATATAQYFQARYEDALASLDAAAQFHALAQGNEWEKQLIAWIRASVLRQRARPEPALSILMDVARQVDEMPAPRGFARVYIALAEVALYLVERDLAVGVDWAVER